MAKVRFTEEELKEHRRESVRKYKAKPENKEKQKEWFRAYRQRNKDKINAYNRELRARKKAMQLTTDNGV